MAFNTNGDEPVRDLVNFIIRSRGNEVIRFKTSVVLSPYILFIRSNYTVYIYGLKIQPPIHCRNTADQA